jgi:hypothetical protein
VYANIHETRQAQMSRGTPSDFRHGPDLPLTRKTIRYLRSDNRANTTNTVVRQCVSCPEARHYSRAENLMKGRGRNAS